MKKYLYLSGAFYFLSAMSSLSAQTWVGMMKDNNANVHDVQKAFYAWYARQPKESKVSKGTGEEEKDGTYMQFKRWEWMMDARTFPTGVRPNLNQLEKDYQGFIKA